MHHGSWSQKRDSRTRRDYSYIACSDGIVRHVVLFPYLSNLGRITCQLVKSGNKFTIFQIRILGIEKIVILVAQPSNNAKSKVYLIV